ncbi:DUF2252 domain-containing protein [Gordonia sp. w5E2]|uniref:DUF2252 domain-containing protein n=1 Tax=Gordonia TaxID=2053 RepID=UPI000AFCB494|nr:MULTISPECIES: DUF2252 domain-containing protein [Gordonia]
MTSPTDAADASTQESGSPGSDSPHFPSQPTNDGELVTQSAALAAGPTEYAITEGSVGKAARKKVPRTSLGEWDPSTRGHDALHTILSQNEIRDQRLLPIRHGRMAASPWTYYRGAAAVMAADLASRPNTGIHVQMCGDAHVLNFGMWNTPERTLAFDLRDFDETLPGPFEWDLLRFVASLVVLARDNGIDEKTAVKAVRAGFTGYRDSIATYATWPILDVWSAKVSADDLVGYLAPDEGAQLDKYLTKRAAKRSNRGASKKFTHLVDGRRTITEDPPYRTHELEQFDDVLNDVLLGYYGSIRENIAALLRRFDLVDVVQQVVGVGSVGMRVYLTLNEEHQTGDPLFFQIKQAAPSVYEKFLGPSVYPNHGQRVVNGQRLIQSASDSFLGWSTIRDWDFYIRQFRDGKVIPDGKSVAPRLATFATACGHVLARAHARSGDARAINEYFGKSDKTQESVVAFAQAYADQTERDHAQLVAAIDDGTVESAPGWP